MKCTNCEEDKPKEEFYAKNVSGWSKLCLTCRKRKAWARNKQRSRNTTRLKAKAAQLIEHAKNKILERDLRSLQSAYKRFTLVNRTQLRLLNDKAAATDKPDPRTLSALERRTEMQEKAKSILTYQINMLKMGVKPKSINELWSIDYGDNARGQGQEQGQEDS